MPELNVANNAYISEILYICKQKPDTADNEQKLTFVRGPCYVAPCFLCLQSKWQETNATHKWTNACIPLELPHQYLPAQKWEKMKLVIKYFRHYASQLWKL